MKAVVSFQRGKVPSAPPMARAAAPLDDSQALLNRLRLVGLRCRAARKVPPIEACQLLGQADGAPDSALAFLLRSLPQALGRMPVFLAPGSVEVSFDEAWLLQLIRALRGQDTLSSDFLLRSRVPLHARRGLVFLLNAALAPMAPPEPKRAGHPA